MPDAELLEKPYQELCEKASFDADAKRRRDALEQTLDEFGVTLKRTRVAGMLIIADNQTTDRLHGYFDLEDPLTSKSIDMLTRFKQLQGKKGGLGTNPS